MAFSAGVGHQGQKLQITIRGLSNVPHGLRFPSLRTNALLYLRPRHIPSKSALILSWLEVFSDLAISHGRQHHYIPRGRGLNGVNASLVLIDECPNPTKDIQ